MKKPEFKVLLVRVINETTIQPLIQRNISSSNLWVILLRDSQVEKNNWMKEKKDVDNDWKTGVGFPATLSLVRLVRPVYQPFIQPIIIALNEAIIHSTNLCNWISYNHYLLQSICHPFNHTLSVSTLVTFILSQYMRQIDL